MSFSFAYICTLLDKLQHIFGRHPPYLPRDVQQMSRRVVTLWFKKHEKRFKEVDGLLLLSILIPERHCLEDYGLSEKDLKRVIGRAFALSTVQFDALLHNSHPAGTRDLGQRVEQVTSECDIAPGQRIHDVSIEEIREILAAVAAQNRSSTVSNRSVDDNFVASALTRGLGPLYRYMQPRERKWLTRFILKSYSPIKMPLELIYTLYHPVLPGLLRVKLDLKASQGFLSQLAHGPAVPTATIQDERMEPVAVVVSPAEGLARDAPRSGSSLSRAAPLDLDNASAIGGEEAIQGAQIQDKGATSGSKPLVQTRHEPQAQTRKSSLQDSKGSSLPLSDITKSTVNNTVALLNTHHVEKSPKHEHHQQSPHRSTSSLPKSPKKSPLHATENVCNIGGNDCLFFKKEAAILTSSLPTPKVRSSLAMHHIKTVSSLGAFIRPPRKVGRHKKRKKGGILLVDQAETDIRRLVEEIQLLNTHDGKGRTRWIELYAHRLLEHLNEAESCANVRPDTLRKYWLGCFSLTTPNDNDENHKTWSASCL